MKGVSPCERKGCERAATHYPMLAAPAQDDGPLVPKMRLSVGLRLCRDHVNELTIETLLGLSGRQTVEQQMAHMRRAAPDFQRAKIEPRRIGDKHWNTVHERKPL